MVLQHNITKYTIRNQFHNKLLDSSDRQVTSLSTDIKAKDIMHRSEITHVALKVS